MFKLNFYKLNLIFIFILFSYLNANQVPPPTDGQLPPNCQELVDKAYEKGSIEILVVLDVPFTPEGELNKEQIKEQRTNISNKKSELRNTISSLTGNAEILKEFKDIIPVVLIKADPVAISELCTNSLIKSIEENKELEPSLLSSIPLINADDASEAGYTGNGWTVAILDSGVDKTHKFLSGKVVYEACYSTNDPANNKETLCPNGTESQIGSGAAAPCSGVSNCDHGTHVSGIAAGKDITYSTNGIYGVARDAQIIAIQVFTKKTADCGTSLPPCLRTYDDDLISALTKVYDLRNTYNIAAVNMSLGGGKNGSYCDGVAIKTIIDNLKSQNIAVVISAGNNGFCDGIEYPACVSSAIPVGSTTKTDSRSSFSNYDPDFENYIFAPGSGILSSILGNNYGSKSGTSMAAPHVTGAFAVIREFVGNTPSVDDIINSLQTTGVAISGFCGGATEPRIDLLASLQDFNNPPSVLNFNATPTIGYAPLTVNFTCSGTDSDGSIASYEWDFNGDGVIDKTTTTGSTSYNYLNKGIYNATCTVVDNLGEKDKSIPKTITVNLQFELSVIKSGSGSGTITSTPAGINCGSDCSELYDEGTNITITANPDLDNAFVKWENDCDTCGTNLNCTVNMNTDIICTAVFEPIYTLNVTKSGTGVGSVVSNPSGINCGTDCYEDYVNGSSITLSVTTTAGNGFFGWSGDCSDCGNNTTCTIDITSDKTCNAEFNKITTNGKMFGQFTLGTWPNIVNVSSQISCNPSVYSMFHITWFDGKYNSVRAYSLTSSVCYDHPVYNSGKPNVEYDSIKAVMTGVMNYNKPVILEIEMNDNGEPGMNKDIVFITVKDMMDNILFTTSGLIESGSVYATPLY